MAILIGLNDARKKLNELEGSAEYNKGVTDAFNALFDLPTIEVEPYIEFCEWVAEEIFGDEGDYWEKVQDAFPELACRRLYKLGIVHKEGDKWLWVDRKELENG